MDYVTQDSMRLVAIGLLSIMAVSMGAATMDSTIALGAPGTDPGNSILPGAEPGAGNSSDLGGDSNASFDQGEDRGGLEIELTRCFGPMAAWYGGIIYFTAFVGVLYGIKRRYSLGAAMLGAYAMGPVVFSGYFLTTDCSSLGSGGGEDNPIVNAFGEAASQSVVSPEVSPLLVAGVFGVAIVAVAVVLLRASGDQTVTTLEEEADEGREKPDVADLAAAAGKAADRLEEHNLDVDNEVYRAWWEMTSLLNVPEPETYTPGEFAEAAVEVGMDEDDVADLTELFEEVRYGRRDPESREERAVAVFRSIESQYGADDDATGGTDGR